MNRTAILIVILAAILISLLATPVAATYEPCQPGDDSLPCIPAEEPTPTPIIGQPCTSDAPWLCYAHQMYLPMISPGDGPSD